MRRLVVLSATPDPTYAPFLPMAAAAWRAIDYHPLCIIVDPPSWQHPPMRAVIDAVGPAEIAHLRTEDIQGFKRSTIAQCSRLVASSIADPSDYLLTSDVDMLPLSRSWFHQQDMSKSFHALGIDPSGSPLHLNMCYLGGLGSNWRSALGISETDLTTSLRSLLSGQRDYWGLDEEIATKKLTNWDRWEGAEVIHRNLGSLRDRIDRSAWHSKTNEPCIDCHCPRPLGAHWRSIAEILTGMVDQETIKKLNEYANKLASLL